MANISKMTTSELEKILAEAKHELVWRENANKALAEIDKILSQYKLRVEDIDWRQLKKKTQISDRTKLGKRTNVPQEKKARKRPKNDRRSAVAPKYLNPNGEEKWSGRGRTPLWIIKICQQENIDIKQFKLDPRFHA